MNNTVAGGNAFIFQNERKAATNEAQLVKVQNTTPASRRSGPVRAGSLPLFIFLQSRISNNSDFIYLSTQYQCFHISLCLKFSFYVYFPLRLVNSLLSSSSCYFLHPRISRSSLSSSSKRILF